MEPKDHELGSKKSAHGRALPLGAALAVLCVPALLVPLALVGLAPVSTRLAAPLVCGTDTVRTAVSLEEAQTDDGTVKVPALWCIDQAQVRHRAGGAQVVVALTLEVLVLGLLLAAPWFFRRSPGSVGSVLLILLLSGPLSGCESGTISRAELDATSRGICHSAAGVRRALAEIRERAGPALLARAVYLGDDWMSVELQDPNSPGHLNSWRWHLPSRFARPVIDDPTPLKADARSEPLLDLAEVPWDRLDGMVTDALAAHPMELGAVSSISLVPSGGEGWSFSLQVRGPRATAVAHFTLDGHSLDARTEPAGSSAANR